MPLYEYRCEACKVRFDLLRSFSEADSPAACPQCGGHDSIRCLSRVAAVHTGDSAGEGAEASSGGGGGCAGCSSGNCAHCSH